MWECFSITKNELNGSHLEYKIQKFEKKNTSVSWNTLNRQSTDAVYELSGRNPPKPAI